MGAGCRRDRACRRVETGHALSLQQSNALSLQQNNTHNNRMPKHKTMKTKTHILTLFLCFVSMTIFAQQKKSSSKVSVQKEAAMELSKSLDEDKPDDVVAADYENLAKKFSDAGNYTKAEENWQKARKIYLKLKNKDKVAAIDRELAKIQEAQNKTELAIQSYNSANYYAQDKVARKLNANDAKRLENQANKDVQVGYIQENIAIAEKSADRADAYKQMADLKMAENKKDEAIGNLQSALKETENSDKAIVIKQEIATAYARNAEYEKAEAVTKDIVTEAKKTSNELIAIEQLQLMSQNYFKGDNREKGIESLQQAYQIAIEQHNTLAAKKSLDLLVAEYRKTNDTKKIVELYDDFAKNFDSVIAADSSLIDTKTILSVEQRIAQLEKERALKDELIARTNTINYFLIGVIALILLVVIVIVKFLFSINKKNKQIALQSLRREMNPHFIFNSLNSINQFIAQNNELEANKYLSSYSKLMRNMMENSNKDFIPLSVELAQLKEYLQLEHMRFSDKFSYTIDVDESIDADALQIPNMLVQPQLENAIWHGLRYKETKGNLSLKIFLENNNLVIKVEDNGIGIRRSRELKTEHQRQHQSRGMTNTNERISLLNNLYRTHISLQVEDKQGNETGVIVMIIVPS